MFTQRKVICHKKKPTAPCTHAWSDVVPPTISEISGDQTVAERGSVTMKCLDDAN